MTNPRLKDHVWPGEVVRVTEGPFADFNGCSWSGDYEKKAAWKYLYLFSAVLRPVELEFGQVEKG